MRFYTKPHQFYCGIDVHARTMYLCVLNQDGEILVHRHMPAGPDPFLTAIAPYREDLVVCVECLFTWDLAGRVGAREGMPVVLGHAISRKAIQGGKAQNDTIHAQKIALLLRGGMLPQAYVYPADRRATRDLLRRRMPLMRQRAERLAHSQTTTRQYNLPELGKTIAYKPNRAGAAERFPAPAVQKSIAVDLALINHDDQLLRDVELSLRNTAKQHKAHTRYLRRTVPGIGEILSLVLRYESHDLQRFPRVHEFVSYGRLITCAKASAGKRSGTSGTKKASLQWAFSDAAALVLRTNPAGHTHLARLEKQRGKSKAWTVLAHQLARAVSSMVKRDTAFDIQMFRQSSPGAEWVSRTSHGTSLVVVLCHDGCPTSQTHKSPSAVYPEPAPLMGQPLRRC